ncbi:MAG TPA: hypothetical protein VF942_03560 [Acidimicrobiales bacterium]
MSVIDHQQHGATVTSSERPFDAPEKVQRLGSGLVGIGQKMHECPEGDVPVRRGRHDPFRSAAAWLRGSSHLSGQPGLAHPGGPARTTPPTVRRSRAAEIRSRSAERPTKGQAAPTSAPRM